MPQPTYDLEALRSFVSGIELGSFAKAATRVSRSPSAVSAQLKKLEQQVGSPLVQKAGRGVVPTPAGEALLGYARRLLALNDEAAAALHGLDLSGVVRIGVQEDFCAGLLISVLATFTRAHPQVRIEAHVARNADLMAGIESAKLDLAMAWDIGQGAGVRTRLGQVALHWIGPPSGSAAMSATTQDLRPLPLAVFEPPCHLRTLATTALDRAGIAWRVAFSSMSLNGIWAAVEAGLGCTVRSTIGMPPHLRPLTGLPALPSIGLALYRAETEPSPAIRRLAETVQASVKQAVAVE